MIQRNKQIPENDAGYTLMELLIVLAILALIATFAIPNLMGIFGSAKGDVAAIQIRNLKGVLDIYRLDNGGYPKMTEGGLQALITRPDEALNWNGPYIENPEALKDPWGMPYHYTFPGKNKVYDLMTMGADGTAGGEGENRDIWN